MHAPSKLSSVGVLCLALAGSACGGGGDDAAGQQQSVTVEAFDNYYEETTIPLELGAEATVTLENGGGVAHSIVIPDLDFELEAQSGETTEGTFSVPNEPGSLDFFCQFHPDEMTGSVTVGGGEEQIEEDVDDPDGDDAEVDVDVEEEDTDGGTTEDIQY